MSGTLASQNKRSKELSIEEKTSDSSQIKTTISKTSLPKPLETHTFKTTSIKNLPKIVGKEAIEIDIEDVLYYKDNIEEYRVQSGEETLPYILRLNGRFKSKVVSMKRTRSAKKGFKVFIFILLTIVVVVLLYFAFVKGKGIMESKS